LEIKNNNIQNKQVSNVNNAITNKVNKQAKNSFIDDDDDSFSNITSPKINSHLNKSPLCKSHLDKSPVKSHIKSISNQKLNSRYPHIPTGISIPSSSEKEEKPISKDNFKKYNRKKQNNNQIVNNNNNNNNNNNINEKNVYSFQDSQEENIDEIEDSDQEEIIKKNSKNNTNRGNKLINNNINNNNNDDDGGSGDDVWNSQEGLDIIVNTNSSLIMKDKNINLSKNINNLSSPTTKSGNESDDYNKQTNEIFNIPVSELLEINNEHELWKLLSDKYNWNWTKAKGLVDFYYKKPGVTINPPFQINKDYFPNIESIWTKVQEFLTNYNSPLITKKMAVSSSSSSSSVVKSRVGSSKKTPNTKNKDKCTPASTNSNNKRQNQSNIKRKEEFEEDLSIYIDHNNISGISKDAPWLRDVLKLKWKILWTNLTLYGWYWEWDRSGEFTDIFFVIYLFYPF
jgi:hypothetical protein